MEECIKDYYKNGNISYEKYFKDGKIYRENLPAQIFYYKNGKIHSEYYYKEGKIHRESGPAEVFYYMNGKIRCEFYVLDGIKYDDKDITDNWEAFCKMKVFI